MLILAFDTSSAQDSLTIYGKGSLADFRFSIPSKQSESLLDVVHLSLRVLGLRPDSIDRIATCVGPGSYTGTRIGIATALGLSKASGIDCCGVDLLNVLAGSVDHVSIPFVEAKGDRIYFKLPNGEINAKSRAEFIQMSKTSEIPFIADVATEFSLGIGALHFDNGLTKSHIIAKIVSNYSKKEMEGSMDALYFN